MIVAQVRAVAEDIGVDAVKIGMLGTAETVEAVVEALGLRRRGPGRVDPVMVAESGAVLLDEEARAALVERLLPLATVVTPNIPEARELTGLARRRLAGGARPRGARAGARSGGRHRRPQRARSSTSSSTAREAAEIARRAPSRRRRARLGLHPLLGAGRLSRPGRDAAGGRAQGARRSPPRRSRAGLRDIG